jgi:hypothetical protein
MRGRTDATNAVGYARHFLDGAAFAELLKAA